MHTYITGSRFHHADDVDASPTTNKDVEAQNVVAPEGKTVVISRAVPVQPVVIAIPHQTGAPEPVQAEVKIVTTHHASASPKHVPFDWVKKNGLGKTGPSVPDTNDKTREEKFVNHASHVATAVQVVFLSRGVHCWVF